ncbi:hypothetical protein NMY22_g8992 [Coprinellus aureogranulatus]|nr:hypothetical protein NMY22_g8992 [Coprinellus aureogranulatus]
MTDKTRASSTRVYWQVRHAQDVNVSWDAQFNEHHVLLHLCFLPPSHYVPEDPLEAEPGKRRRSIRGPTSLVCTGAGLGRYHIPVDPNFDHDKDLRVTITTVPFRDYRDTQESSLTG